MAPPLQAPGTAHGGGVHAILVVHRPAPGLLQAVLACIAHQVDAIWIIDNGGDGAGGFDVALPVQAQVVSNGENRGLAFAYNQGASMARRAGASHVLLLDQDSRPAADMVAQLLAALRRLEAEERAVAVVGPCYTDDKWAVPVGFVRAQGCALKPVDIGNADDVAVHHLISSGSLIALHMLERVGPFEEKLFIDYVDIEWCMRAASFGFQCIGIPAARMRHDLGDRLLDSERPVLTQHVPLRQYYQYRNATWLMLRPWVGMRWRLIELRRMAGKSLRLLRHAPRRAALARMALRGVGDALRGRMGRALP